MFGASSGSVDAVIGLVDVDCDETHGMGEVEHILWIDGVKTIVITGQDKDGHWQVVWHDGPVIESFEDWAKSENPE